MYIYIYIYLCWDKLTDKSGISLVPVPMKDKNVIFHHSIGRFYQDFWEKIKMTIRMIRSVMVYVGYSGKL